MERWTRIKAARCLLQGPYNMPATDLLIGAKEETVGDVFLVS